MRKRRKARHRAPVPLIHRLALAAACAAALATGFVPGIARAAPARPAAAAIPVHLGMPVLPAAAKARAGPAQYVVRPGDTLSGIAGRLCGNPADWPGLAAASGIADANVIRIGQVITIRCSTYGTTAARTARYISGGGFSSSIVYSYGMLEAIWRAAGGAGRAQSTAACIAEHESGGRPWAISPTNDYGLWQINGSHGALATLNAFGNARAAVIISSGGAHWGAWTTRYSCGAPAAKITGRAVNIVLDAYRTPAASYESPGARALDWAERYALGHWYAWGGTGPSYDCSGLVYESLGRATGIWLPRTTYGMPGSAHLVRTYSPQRGDLAFFGSGHVEFVTALWHVTFGAQQSGTRVGWHTWSGWWHPTAFYRVV